MRTQIGLLSIAGFLGLLAAAEAASPFDGTYQVASASKVSETYITRAGATGMCQDRSPGTLTVVDGVARYTTQSGDTLAAQVDSNGQFEMRHVDPDGSGALRVLGTISPNGKASARQMGNSCAYDFVWQK